jgi:hypothetical protein
MAKLLAPPNSGYYCQSYYNYYSSYPNAYSYFGNGVWINDNYAIVGAPGANYYSGSAYIYTIYAQGNTQVWSLAQTLSSPDGGNNYFGYKVSITNKWAVVGAPAYSSWQWNGAAYVYRLQSDYTWTLSALLTMPLTSTYSTYAAFGYSVAIGGNWLAIGAPFYSPSSSVYYSGAAFLYHYSESTGWNMTSSLSPGSSIYAFYGWSVDVTEDYAVVGQNCLYGTGGYYYSSWSCQEAVYVYKLDCGQSTFTQKIICLQQGVAFGTSVSVNPNFIVVGAPYYSYYMGAAYVYELRASTWTHTNVLTLPASSSCWAEFGYRTSVSSSEWLIVGSFGYHNGTGASWIYKLTVSIVFFCC